MRSRISSFVQDRRLRARPICSCLFVLLLAGATGTGLYRRSRIADTRIETGRFYEVAVSAGRAPVVLDFEDATRYVLIIGSLGDSSKRFPVRITSHRLGKDSRRIRDIRPVKFDCQDDGDVSFEASFLNAISLGLGNHRRHSTHAKQVLDVPDAQPPSEESRSFHLHVTDGPLDDANQYTQVRSRLIASGETVRVYLDRNQPIDSQIAELCQEIVRLLDEEIVATLRRSLGTVSDVDNDGKLAVLLTPWLSRLQGGTTSLGGFVRGSDFDAKSKKPFGNHCDVLYLNPNLRPGSHLRDIIAHELTHAVCFSTRKRPYGSLRREEDWLNEAIAHLSESQWTNLDYRISRFLEAPHEFPLVVPDYYRAGLWRNHGCRGATFLFLRWCMDAFGDDVRKRLVNNSSTGVTNLEELTGVPFERLFRYWSIALYRSTQAEPSRPLPEGIPAFRSIDLCGRLTEWGLAGPRCQSYDVDQLDHTLGLKGTSVAFVELNSAAGSFEVSVVAQPGASLIVSVMRLPEESPQVELDVKWQCGFDELPNRTSEILLDVKIAVRNSATRFETELIACEQNEAHVTESICLTGDSLQNCRVLGNQTIVAVDSVVSRSAAKKHTSQVRRFLIPVPWARRRKTPITIKAVVKDSVKRRATVRIVIPPPSKNTSDIRVAAAGRRQRQ